MALNLLRNSRVFFTTDLDSSGKVNTGAAMTAATTRELQVLDGFSFSQNTGQETVTTNEAGISPVRGQRSFNTSLEPVDWSFTTYIRPVIAEGATTTTGIDADDVVDAEESVLWNAMASSALIGATGAAWTQTSGTVSAGPPVSYSVKPVSTVTFANSNIHQLQAFGLIIVFEDVTYVIDNCAIDSATIDFGLDAIAAVQWAGKGTEMRQLANTVIIGAATAGTVALTGGITGASAVAKAKNTDARFIANKLSTMTLTAAGFGGVSAGSYTIALTGGNLTISNNLTYLTPANLGVVNKPITYFTGTRSVTANVTAYLKTGLAGSNKQGAGLLNDLLTASNTSTENKFSSVISLGGASNDTRLDLDMPTVQLTIPSITSEQIISTSITMTAQGSTTGAAGGTYDLEGKNEISIKYYAAV
jgi:hypothetical protein